MPIRYIDDTGFDIANHRNVSLWKETDVETEALTIKRRKLSKEELEAASSDFVQARRSETVEVAIDHGMTSESGAAIKDFDEWVNPELLEID